MSALLLDPLGPDSYPGVAETHMSKAERFRAESVQALEDDRAGRVKLTSYAREWHAYWAKPSSHRHRGQK